LREKSVGRLLLVLVLVLGCSNNFEDEDEDEDDSGTWRRMTPAITMEATALEPSQISVLLRGDPPVLREWTERWEPRRLALWLSVIIGGAGGYGAAMGYWRDPLQALFVAIKFPLIVLLTTLGNALLNAMLAPLLGLNLGLRQSFLAVLMSFTITAAILGSFSPLVAFMVWNAPSITDARGSGGAYGVIQLTHVGVIAFAGIVGNLRLAQLLRLLSGKSATARRVLFAWLAVNLFLGSQLSWILRPFIGSPGLPVEFLRKNAMHGNFYEAVFRDLVQLFR
jgi:hypothetical protein